MRIWMSALAASVLALPAAAQDEPKPEIEKVPAPKAAAPECYTEKCRTTYNLHWLEREVKVIEKTPILKERTTPIVKPTLEIHYNQVPRTKIEYVLKPREVVKEITICTKIPKVVKDPHTGCDTIVFEPVTEKKLVTEITYCIVPEEKTVMVERPFLKCGEEARMLRTLWLDWEIKEVTKLYRFGILVPVEIKEKKPCPPPCPPLPPLPPLGCTTPVGPKAEPPLAAPEAPRPER